MKWYKHMSDSADDPDIDDAISLFGADGYYVFFRTLEIMAREFDINLPGKNIFSIRFMKKKYHISWKKVVKILEFFSEKGRIIMLEVGGQRLDAISLYCPKLEQLTDEYTKKRFGKVSGQTPDECPDKLPCIEEEEEEEEEVEEESYDWELVSSHWNSLVKGNNIKKVLTISDDRKKKYKLRCKEAGGQEAFWSIVEKELFSLSDFAKEGNWFGFGWLIHSQNNFLKFREGNYRNKDDVTKEPVRKQASPIATFERILNEILISYDNSLDRTGYLNSIWDKYKDIPKYDGVHVVTHAKKLIRERGQR